MPRLCVLFLLLAVLPARVWANANEALPRIGNWEIDYDQDSCHLRAYFGDARSPVRLRILQIGASDNFQMTIASSEFRLPAKLPDARISFVPQNISFSRSASRVDERGLPALALNAVRLDGKNWDAKERVDPAIASGIKRIDIEIEGMEAIRLNTGSLTAPFKALSACTSDLLRTWGFDPTSADRLAKTPEPRTFPGSWATSLDYPPDALKSRFEGVTKFRIDIEATGKPRRCTVTGSSGSQEVDIRTCQLMMARSSFHPARDKGGAAMPWYWMSSVKWSLPY